MTANRALARIPPPLLFLVVFLSGVLFHRALPVALGSIAAPLGIAGIVLIAAGVLLAAASVGLFARTRTTIVPHHRPGHLVTSGPYRLSRNPMYVSLTSIYLGVALWLGYVWPLLLVALPLLFLDRLVIPVEEQNLRAVFKEEYEGYCRRVRRWL
jgi:protein-S-isoprenylcysteine O-methyltransferase Ste14